MPVWWRFSWLILLLLGVPQLAQSRSYPSTPDAAADSQQRWGASQSGYIADGCWFTAGPGASVQMQPCRAFAVEMAPDAAYGGASVPALKGFGDGTVRSLSLTGGDGIYWLAGRTTPSLAPVGWTCPPGGHYCWQKAEDPPGEPAGVLLLGKTTVVTGVAQPGVIMAPWRRSTPYTVPAGVTLTFGVCPEVGRQHLFDANGTSSGLVRFTGGGCGQVYPEWWGVDPTGLVDSTALWNVVVRAASAGPGGVEHGVPISCQGVYAISAAAGQWAIELRDGTQILGTFRKGNSPRSLAGYPCLFKFTGAGSALYGPHKGSTYDDMRLEHLAITDDDDTGKYGIYCGMCGSIRMENLYTERFETGMYFDDLIFYGQGVQLKAAIPRKICVVFTGGLNNTYMDVQCAAQEKAGLTHGIVVSDGASGDFHNSINSRLNFVSEIGSGIPIYLARVKGIVGNMYIETQGPCADFPTDGVLHLTAMSGGHLNVRIAHNCSGEANNPLPIAVRAFNPTPNFLGTDVRNLTITGEIVNTFTTAVQLDAGPGAWGLDLSGLSIAGNNPLRTGLFTTGSRVGDNYITHGLTPTVDEGRGDSGTELTTWRQGDLIWESSGITPTVLRNRLYQVSFGGNPPSVGHLMIPAILEVTGVDGLETPSLLNGAIRSNRIVLKGTGAITNFLDGIAGQCLIVRSEGTRTVTEGPNIALNGATNFAMTSGDMLHVCLNGGIWFEVGRSVNRSFP